MPLKWSRRPRAVNDAAHARTFVMGATIIGGYPCTAVLLSLTVPFLDNVKRVMHVMRGCS